MTLCWQSKMLEDDETSHQPCGQNQCQQGVMNETPTEAEPCRGPL
jgi:hypothetical protein